SAGATARIETVLLTHLAHDLDVLAAGDETDDGRGQLAARDCAFDDVSLPAAVSRISALGIDHAAIVDRPVFDIRNLRPPILRPAWIDDRKTDRLADDLLFLRQQVARVDAARVLHMVKGEQVLGGRMPGPTRAAGASCEQHASGRRNEDAT